MKDHITGGENMDYLTVAEVAEVLKVSQKTVRSWIQSLDLPASKLGREYRVQRNKLEKWISDHAS